MKKDLILITSFVPDDKRQQMLRKLVYGINGSNFDIMISSHSYIPQDIFEKVDYVIYEKKNDLDFNFENKFLFFFSGHGLSVKTTEVKKFNHFIPVIRHISSGLIYAKSLGYDKVHYFEYDSLIENDNELIENSNLLSEYSAVFYSPPNMMYPNSPISFNLNKISEKWFSLDRKNYDSFLRSDKSSKLVEEYEWNLLRESGKLYVKDISDLKDKKINVSLNQDLEDNKWVVPLYDKQNNSMVIFSWVENDQDIDSEVIVIVNNDTIIKIDRGLKKYWKLYELGEISHINQIKIIVNDVVRRSYIFDEKTMSEFIKYNYISRNE